MTTKFAIKTEQFEGPLDLLLNLIEKRKLLINDISLAKVTDDYLGYLKNLPQFSIPESANFILIASTLVLIKSRSLLPVISLSEEEEMSIEELQERLRVYKILKEATAGLREHFGRKIIFPKSSTRMTVSVFSPAEDLSLDSLVSSMQNLLANLPKNERLPKTVVEKVISLEEMIDSLTVRIKDSLKMSFREFTKISKENKINIIVSFLAMLELVKQGIIDVTQNTNFDDIHMETQSLETPKYN
ncbi:MAG TPA: ScpA family protein [Candidatus Paceibacterota bacterium]|nr:ScpA family protein [Candidatus Paceibacterota bacterium]